MIGTVRPLTVTITIDLVRHTAQDRVTGLTDNAALALAKYGADALAKTFGERRDTIVDNVRITLRSADTPLGDFLGEGAEFLHTKGA